jgi:hypothetical protein
MTSPETYQVSNGIESQYVTLVNGSGAKGSDAIAPRGRTRGLLTTATAVIPIPAGTKAVKLYASTLARVGAGILDGDQPMLVPTTVDLAGGVSAGSRLPVVTQSTPAANVSGFIEAASEFLFAVVSTDAYIHLTADSGTGVYRLSWFS